MRSCKEECKFLCGYPKESTERMLQMSLKEKVLVEEKNPQDYQKKEEKVRNRKEKALHGEFARLNFRCLERNSGDGSRMIL